MLKRAQRGRRAYKWDVFALLNGMVVDKPCVLNAGGLLLPGEPVDLCVLLVFAIFFFSSCFYAFTHLLVSFPNSVNFKFTSISILIEK